MKPSKHSMHKWIVGFAIFAILLFFLIFSKGLSLDSSKIPSPLLGQSAREFQLPLLQGSELLLGHKAEAVHLAELKGFPLILNFWASWCSTCAEESKVLEAFWRAHSSEIKILGIAVHDKSEDVLSSIQRLSKTYPIGLDEGGRTALDYGVTGVPESIFIDAQGLIVHKQVGPLDRKLLETLLVKLKQGST